MPRPANPYDDIEIMGSTNPDNFVPAIAVGNNVGGRPTPVVAAQGSEGRRQAQQAADFAGRNRVRSRAQGVTSRRATPSTPRTGRTSTTPRNRRDRAASGVRRAGRRVANVAEGAANRFRGRRGRRR
jgi:hypothetical protein